MSFLQSGMLKKPTVHRVSAPPTKTAQSQQRPTAPKIATAATKKRPTQLVAKQSKDALGRYPLSPAVRALNSAKRKATSASPRLSSDDEGDDGDSWQDLSAKRIKSISVEPEIKRTLWKIEKRQDGDMPEKTAVDAGIIHGEDMTLGSYTAAYSPVFTESSEVPTVHLQYPSFYAAERVRLVQPRDATDYKPLEEMFEVIEQVAEHFLPHEISQPLLDENSGIVRRLKRARRHQNLKDFLTIVEEWNKIVRTARDDGTIAKVFVKRHMHSSEFIEAFMNICYKRTVSPEAKSLREYDNGSSYVYGELMPRFSSQTFRDTRLNASNTFIDLGSGVGNAVLQAALETGAASYGCEYMPNPCGLAKRQQAEFEARCKLWGLQHGAVTLWKGDFTDHDGVRDVLGKADILLVNNKVFSHDLNEALVRMFLDLKIGAQIVSLHSFKPNGWKLGERNMDNPVNRLEVTTKEYGSGSVSWSGEGGHYYVSKVDLRGLQRFKADMERGRSRRH